MSLSREAKSHLREIEEACVLSKDTPGIAKYYHVQAHEVEQIRVSLDARLVEEEEAKRSSEEAGSLMLRGALDGLFRKWEKQHGFRKGAGAILVPAGYQVPA